MKRCVMTAGSVVVLLLAVVLCNRALADCPQLAVALVSLPQATIGEPYAQKLPVFGGKAPVTVQISDGMVPPGLTLGEDGKLTGTPRVDGEYRLTVTATDSCSPRQSASQEAQLVVTEKGVPSRSQPTVIKEKKLAVTVQSVPAAVTMPAGETTVQVTYHVTAKPSETAVLQSPGRSFVIDGAVIVTEGIPLAVTLVNGVGEVKETLTVPRLVLEESRREKGAKIVQSRPFVGHGTTALGVVEISLAQGAAVGR